MIGLVIIDKFVITFLLSNDKEKLHEHWERIDNGPFQNIKVILKCRNVQRHLLSVSMLSNFNFTILSNLKYP